VVGKPVVGLDTKIGPHAFTVNFQYGAGKDEGESVIVISDNYSGAIDEAYEERVEKHLVPIAVEIIDPDLAVALEFVERKVKAGATKLSDAAKRGIAYTKPRIKPAIKLGAKYAVKATVLSARTAGKAAMGVTKFGADIARMQFDTKIVQYLIKDCYSKDPVKRNAARSSLKRKYPDVYDSCDFSDEGDKPTRIIERTIYKGRELDVDKLTKLVDKRLKEEKAKLKDMSDSEEEKFILAMRKAELKKLAKEDAAVAKQQAEELPEAQSLLKTHKLKKDRKGPPTMDAALISIGRLKKHIKDENRAGAMRELRQYRKLEGDLSAQSRKEIHELAKSTEDIESRYPEYTSIELLDSLEKMMKDRARGVDVTSVDDLVDILDKEKKKRRGK